MNSNALQTRWRRLAPVALALLLAPHAAAAAEEEEEPTLPIHPEEAVVALTRILDMDRNLTMRSDDKFMVILVPYEKGQEEALEVLLRICRYVARTRYFRGRGLRHIPVQLKAPGMAAAFKEALLREKASAVLVPAGLSVAARDAVAQAANEEKLHTLAMDPTQVERWFTVAVEPAPGKMQVVFNADNVRNAEGLFEPALLTVSKILNADPNRNKKPPKPAKPPKPPKP